MCKQQTLNDSHFSGSNYKFDLARIGITKEKREKIELTKSYNNPIKQDLIFF